MYSFFVPHRNGKLHFMFSPQKFFSDFRIFCVIQMALIYLFLLKMKALIKLRFKFNLLDKLWELFRSLAHCRYSSRSAPETQVQCLSPSTGLKYLIGH